MLNFGFIKQSGYRETTIFDPSFQRYEYHCKITTVFASKLSKFCKLPRQTLRFDRPHRAKPTLEPSPAALDPNSY